MGRRLEGKVAIVSGAGRSAPGLSIGTACAALLAREGASVFALDVDIDRMAHLKELVGETGGRCVTFACDVTDSDQVRAAVAACLERLGGHIDVVVNNVGRNAPGGVLETDDDSFDRTLRVNARSTLAVCRAAIPSMIARRSGSIVNISSLASMRYAYPSLAYAAAKGAVNQITRQIAGQYAEQGIRCNAVLPGYIASAASLARLADGSVESGASARARREAAVPMRRLGDPGDVAEAVAFLASDRSRYITGVELVVDGGLSIVAA